MIWTNPQIETSSVLATDRLTAFTSCCRNVTKFCQAASIPQLPCDNSILFCQVVTEGILDTKTKTSLWILFSLLSVMQLLPVMECSSQPKKSLSEVVLLPTEQKANKPSGVFALPLGMCCCYYQG